MRQKYKLELHWEFIHYHNDNTAVLQEAYFTGPALKIAEKIQAPDKILLDMTPQHLVVLGTYYVVRLYWDEVNYIDDKVYLKGARLTNTYLKELHKLCDSDYIQIDTSNHEEEKHPYHLVYESKVMRKEGTPYKYEE